MNTNDTNNTNGCFIIISFICMGCILAWRIKGNNFILRKQGKGGNYF